MSRVLLLYIIIILYIYYTSDYTVLFFYIVLKTHNNNNIIIVYFHFQLIYKKTLLPSQARALKINYHEKTTSQFHYIQILPLYNSYLCSLYEPF